MKYALARYDDEGAIYVPRFSGADWAFHKLSVDPSNPARRIAEATPAAVPPTRMLLATPDGWQATIFFFQDDGSSPDPRPGKHVVSISKRIPYRMPNGRERTPNELARDLDHLIAHETKRLAVNLQRVTCCGPTDMPSEQAIADAACAKVADCRSTPTVPAPGGPPRA